MAAPSEPVPGLQVRDGYLVKWAEQVHASCSVCSTPPPVLFPRGVDVSRQRD